MLESGIKKKQYKNLARNGLSKKFIDSIYSSTVLIYYFNIRTPNKSIIHFGSSCTMKIHLHGIRLEKSGPIHDRLCSFFILFVKAPFRNNEVNFRLIRLITHHLTSQEDVPLWFMISERIFVISNVNITTVRDFVKEILF